MEKIHLQRRAPLSAPRGVIQFPRSRRGLGNYFFDGMNEGRQRLRIRELCRSGLSPDLVALITRRGVGAVREAVGS
jgi:hypothetical protein